jgi:cytochrome c6
VRILRTAVAIWLLALTSSGVWAADAGELARGKELFGKIQPSCAVCHTLQAAGAEGQVGPVLDELKPNAERVLRALRAGIGVMPSYADKLSDKDMRALAHFVAQASGAAP